MGITYHSNAKTSVHIRKEIQNATETLDELASKYNVNINTIFKWKHRENLEDKSSRPNKLQSVLTELDELIICEVRKTTLLGLDDLTNILKEFIPAVNRDNIYRCLKRNNLSDLKALLSPKDTKEEIKQFKTYEPGYIHVDIKYLPKLKGEQNRKYLYVAIDRATRFVYLSIKENKEAETASNFLSELISFFPYKINKVLTDNGKEFTDKFTRNRKEPSGNHAFDVECSKYKIEHRLTKPYTPKTNGMVERFNGRVEEILAENNFSDYSQLEKSFKYYLSCYNNFIKQKVLDYKTPVEMIKEWYIKKPELFKENFDISTYNLSQHDNYSSSKSYR